MIFSKRTLIVAVLVVSLTGILLVPTAALAQEDGDGNESDGSDGPQVSVDLGDQDENETIAVVDPAVKVVSASYDGDRIRLVVESTVRKPLTVVESTSGKSEGAGRISVRKTILDDDAKNVIKIPVSGDEPAVVLSTSTSISNGHATYIKVEGGSSLIDGEATWIHVRNAMLIGAVGGVGIAVWLTREKWRAEPEAKAERFL